MLRKMTSPKIRSIGRSSCSQDVNTSVEGETRLQFYVLLTLQQDIAVPAATPFLCEGLGVPSSRPLLNRTWDRGCRCLYWCLTGPQPTQGRCFFLLPTNSI